MIGIVIPAHNEAELVQSCVLHAKVCGRHPRLSGESVEIVVVADSCTDETASLAAQAGATVLIVHARNVGLARAAGAALLLQRGARWLAFTDADTEVSPAWLVEQLERGADAVCGTVEVLDWTAHGEHAGLIAQHFAETYTDADDHRHIHGANLGISAEAYRRAGGFKGLACSEDHDLVAALEASGARICWSARPRVTTSARRIARAPEGFATALINAVAQRLQAAKAAAA